MDQIFYDGSDILQNIVAGDDIGKSESPTRALVEQAEEETHLQI